eukprot:3941244-Rhodomonas_salina.1
MRCPVLSLAIVLCACYAMSGTDIDYGATDLLGPLRAPPLLPQQQVRLSLYAYAAIAGPTRMLLSAYALRVCCYYWAYAYAAISLRVCCYAAITGPTRMLLSVYAYAAIAGPTRMLLSLYCMLLSPRAYAAITLHACYAMFSTDLARTRLSAYARVRIASVERMRFREGVGHTGMPLRTPYAKSGTDYAPPTPRL